MLRESLWKYDFSRGGGKIYPLPTFNDPVRTPTRIGVKPLRGLFLKFVQNDIIYVHIVFLLLIKFTDLWIFYWIFLLKLFIKLSKKTVLLFLFHAPTGALILPILGVVRKCLPVFTKVCIYKLYTLEIKRRNCKICLGFTN